MDKMRFPKGKLVEVLKENRDKHRQEYDEAVAGYRKEVLAFCKETVKKYSKAARAVEAGEPIPEGVDLISRKPEHHLNDYDRVLRMLELTVDDVVELDNHDAAQYVQDDWSWKERFVASTARYK